MHSGYTIKLGPRANQIYVFIGLKGPIKNRERTQFYKQVTAIEGAGVLIKTVEGRYDTKVQSKVAS